jgi:hypothetical protein
LLISVSFSGNTFIRKDDTLEEPAGWESVEKE